ncbi:hypothetical protein EV426DRAFT_578774 [Tirmania nivea]|nr:hypothetical protein EV426DRAFT_578774 [Tirmania nivea]
MSTPIIKLQNTITGFKSRIPVACGHHRPESTKPSIRAALGELSGEMKSRIPVLKNPKRQTPSSVTNLDAGQLILTRTVDKKLQTPVTTVCNSRRFHHFIGKNMVLDTESHTALLRERSSGMKISIQGSLSTHTTVASTTKKHLFNKNARAATRTVVTCKLSQQTGQPAPAMVDSSVDSRKISPPTCQSMSVMADKAVATRKVSPPTGQSTTVMANKAVITRISSPPTNQSTGVANNSDGKFSPPTGQSASVVSNKAIVTRKISPPTGQSASVTAKKSVVTRKLAPPTGQSAATTDTSVETRRCSPAIYFNGK